MFFHWLYILVLQSTVSCTLIKLHITVSCQTAKSKMWRICMIHPQKPLAQNIQGMTWVTANEPCAESLSTSWTTNHHTICAFRILWFLLWCANCGWMLDHKKWRESVQKVDVLNTYQLIMFAITTTLYQYSTCSVSIKHFTLSQCWNYTKTAFKLATNNDCHYWLVIQVLNYKIL